jgi:DNA-binding PadR family transcriptional regulator
MANGLGSGDLSTLVEGEACERGIDPRSSAMWLVLALVIQQPSHGYEIDRRYDSRFGSFLPLTTSRVYGALARLSDAGLIERIALKPEGRSRKQHKLRQSYRATRTGVQAYRQWAAERMLDDPQRVEILSRIASVGLLGFDAVVDVVDRYEQGCMQELMVIPTESERLEAGEYTPEELWECLIVEQRRRELKARREWATYARHVLRAHRRRLGGGNDEDA